MEAGRGRSEGSRVGYCDEVHEVGCLSLPGSCLRCDTGTDFNQRYCSECADALGDCSFCGRPKRVHGCIGVWTWNGRFTSRVDAFRLEPHRRRRHFTYETFRQDLPARSPIYVRITRIDIANRGGARLRVARVLHREPIDPALTLYTERPVIEPACAVCGIPATPVLGGVPAIRTDHGFLVEGQPVRFDGRWIG